MKSIVLQMHRVRLYFVTLVTWQLANEKDLDEYKK